MRYVRHIEDAYGSLIDVLYYCSELCFREEPESSVAALPGGWWPCLEAELESPEACRVCGESIGPLPGCDSVCDPEPYAARPAEGRYV